MYRRAFILSLMLAITGLSHAAPPAWWAARGATNANPANDDSAVNQGQLKQFTQKAVDELSGRIPGGAGTDLDNLVAGWLQEYQTGAYSAANPLPADFNTMTAGQLKWIANKIHARLIFAKYEDALPAWLVQNPATDKQLVNLGQLKSVFNFEFTAPAGLLPAWWQKFHFNGQTGIDPDGNDDSHDLTNGQKFAFGGNPHVRDTNGDGISDLEEYNEAEVKYPLIWEHRQVNAGVGKTGAFQQFTPTVPAAPPTPVISYYLKKQITILDEITGNFPTTSNSTYHYKYGNTDISTLDNKTFVLTYGLPIIDFNINTLPGYYPDFRGGHEVWETVSQSDTRTFTKTVDNYSLSGSYRITDNNSTGSETYSSVTTLSDEYTTAMLIEAGDAAFDGKVLVEENKPWGSGFSAPDLSTYTKKDETSYSRMEIDYALEPHSSPAEPPVRVVWLDVNRTDLGRGYSPTDPDPAATQSITLHEEYYSRVNAWNFAQTPSDAKFPRTKIHRLAADLNMQRLILPLSCSLDVNFNPGSIIAAHDANGQALPIDWDDLDGGYLGVSYAHNHWYNDVQYGDIIGDEFDVPVKLEAVEGGENIRLAEIITTSSGTVYLPVSLPIADVRDYTEGFVVQTISPGKVALRASLTTKHGLNVSKRSVVENSLPPVLLVVMNNGIGDMVPSVLQGKPYHFVTPKKSTDLPADKVVVLATSPGMTPDFFQEFYDWDMTTQSGSPDANNPTKFEVDRTNPTKAMVRLIETKTGNEVAHMYVWVVWADPVIPFQVGKTKFDTIPYQITNGNTPTDCAIFLANPLPYWKFSFTIQPATIITDSNSGQDAPSLAGTLPQGTYIPGDAGAHPILGNTGDNASGQFKYGASRFWDVSRQMEVTVNNPGLIPYENFPKDFHDLYENQKSTIPVNPGPHANSIPIPFPTDPVMGNDDVGRLPDQIARDEDNDPYVPRANDYLQLAHGIGVITSNDGPSSQIPDVAGVEGREYEELNHFREFVRLKLPGGWFRVSDYVDWHFDMKVKFTGGKWQNNGSFPAPSP